jgi:hypothetical protein
MAKIAPSEEQILRAPPSGSGGRVAKSAANVYSVISIPTNSNSARMRAAHRALDDEDAESGLNLAVDPQAATTPT